MRNKKLTTKTRFRPAPIVKSLKFNVGPFVYTAIVSDRALFRTDGGEVEGFAIERPRLILISRCVRPEQREEVIYHEYVHAWEFHVPEPKDAEERCQLSALIQAQFHNDLEAQGGRDAIERMIYTPVPHLGKPQIDNRKLLVTFGDTTIELDIAARIIKENGKPA